MILHQSVSDFLRSCPVAVEFFERAVGIDAQCAEHFEESAEHADGSIHHSAVLGDVFAVDHARNEIVDTGGGGRHFTHHVRSVGAAVVHQAGIALLRHSGRDVGVLAAFLQKDPRARLSVLHHHVRNEAADVQSGGRIDAREFERHICGRHAGGIKGVAARRRKAKAHGHRLAVEGPARAVQYRGAHRTGVIAGETLVKTFAVAQERGGNAEEIVRIAVGLSGHAVGVVGHNRMTVGLCEIEELPDYCVKGFGNLHGAVAENGRPLGGENVLTRTAGVDKGYRRRSFCDEERLIGNVAFHAQRRILFGLGFKTSDAARGFPCSFL